jgi:gamma-glutamylcyclotransferase (GGCT)/AIG2-like uncharacterized protein YtfP
MGASQSKTGGIVRATTYRITDNKSKRGLYFAYGSNLCLSQMLGHRCPKAQPLFKARLNNWRLAFRGCADVERAPGESVTGGVFEITPECEAALDRYEGYPNLYTKATAKIKLADGTPRTMMFYVMTRQAYESGPNESYFDTILKGYADFQMSDAEFDALLAAAERADSSEQRFRLENPHMVRNKRGRYESRPFLTARDLQRETVRPYTDNQLELFLTEHGIEPRDFEDDQYLSDLIGTLADE